MQVIVNKLNRRRHPVTDFSDKSNVVEVLTKGHAFEAVGDIVNALGKWYVDKEGYCVWAGGVDNNFDIQVLSSATAKWTFDEVSMGWIHKSRDEGGLGIVDLWNRMGVRGENVNLLILDTGITKNDSQFRRNGLSSIKANLCIEELQIRPEDISGHGTNSASIIGATGNHKEGETDNVFCGIAPESNLYIIKFAGSYYANPDKFLSGLKLINSSWPIDIVSISFYFPGLATASELFKSKIKETSIVLSALHHPDTPGISFSNDQYPAAFENVIPVASSLKTLHELYEPCELMNAENKKNWVFPGDDIKVLDRLGRYTSAGQTSIATPVGAGVMALFLSYMKLKKIAITKHSVNTLIELMTNTSDFPVSFPGMDKKICFCNPLAAFEQFNNYFKSPS